MDLADLDLVDPSLLPPQMRRLVDIIGLPETLQLLEQRGGIFLYVPMQVGTDSVLAGILSPQALTALVSSDLAGERLELPKCDKIIRQIRNRALREARKNVSAAKVARAFNLTRRQVINIANIEPDDSTPDLFTCTPEPSGSN